MAVHVVSERCEHIADMAAEEMFVLVGRSSVKVVDQDMETKIVENFEHLEMTNLVEVTVGGLDVEDMVELVVVTVVNSFLDLVHSVVVHIPHVMAAVEDQEQDASYEDEDEDADVAADKVAQQHDLNVSVMVVHSGSKLLALAV